jgi:hypothetical protein
MKLEGLCGPPGQILGRLPLDEDRGRRPRTHRSGAVGEWRSKGALRGH